MRSCKNAVSLFALLALWSSVARAELGLNFPPPASEGARQIYDIHMLTLGIATVLMLIVSLIVIYSIVTFRKDKGYVPDQRFHLTRFGTWSWVLVPLLVLGVDLAIAGNAKRVLEAVWLVPKDESMLAVKVTGHQWWWEFEYLDHDVKVESRFVPKDQAGDLYLREVDQRLILPINTPIRFLHTSADVLHAFWVPELGFKKDAIPGYVTETWATLEKEGVFRGQCAELCGTWHSRMPLVVESVSPERFDAWMTEKRAEKLARLQEDAANKEWTLTALVQRGQQEYNTYCAGCHQAGGEGMPPAFPALKGSAIVTGPTDAHIRRVLDGAPGTAMPSWAHLSDLQVAAIVTYERNVFNGLADAVQPASVRASR